jgi:hypothetical protein
VFLNKGCEPSLVVDVFQQLQKTSATKAIAIDKNMGFINEILMIECYLDPFVINTALLNSFISHLLVIFQP